MKQDINWRKNTKKKEQERRDKEEKQCEKKYTVNHKGWKKSRNIME